MVSGTSMLRMHSIVKKSDVHIMFISDQIWSTSHTPLIFVRVYC